MGSIIGTVILLAVLVVSAFLLIRARQKKLISSARRKDNAIVSPRASVWTYRAKRIEKRRNSDNILRLLAPSVIGASICAVCLCGASWAWFTAATEASTTTIRSATFQISDVDVTANASETNDAQATTVQAVKAEGGKFVVSLPGKGSYMLRIIPAADNTSTKGFCCITIFENNESAGTAYYTSNISEDGFSVNIQADKNIRVVIEPIWGDVAAYNTSVTPLADGGNIPAQKSAESSGSGQAANDASQATDEIAAPAQNESDKANVDGSTAEAPTPVSTPENNTTASSDSEDKTAAPSTPKDDSPVSNAPADETPASPAPEEKNPAAADSDAVNTKASASDAQDSSNGASDDVKPASGYAAANDGADDVVVDDDSAAAEADSADIVNEGSAD